MKVAATPETGWLMAITTRMTIFHIFFLLPWIVSHLVLPAVFVFIPAPVDQGDIDAKLSTLRTFANGSEVFSAAHGESLLELVGCICARAANNFGCVAGGIVFGGCAII